MFHMKEAKIGGSACVLVLLFSGLVTCSGVFGSPLTDDVATLDTLRENLPKDYKIPVRYISKDVGGACWLHLNLYPLEISLKTLALKFGNLSSNRENITIFITMLQGLRFTVDNEELEATMQAFKCHYRSVRWSTRRYFGHVKEVLVAFASAPLQFHCTPPPCPTVPPITTGQDSQKHVIDRAIPGLLALLIIPCGATLALFLRTVLCRKVCCARRRRETDTCTFPGADSPETQSDPEDGSSAAHNDPESSSLNKQCRVQQDTLGSEDTAV
ncbi:kit ligand b isoform X2 [Colossoma macropomum]|uniref:kit ligand b isoform X2 n=1 Tax=Colossoma macropomum TaxID=42526 RepID=UPI001864AB6E|nr:kit ligand b isoform X2 [Colossoma macropomum]